MLHIALRTNSAFLSRVYMKQYLLLQPFLLYLLLHLIPTLYNSHNNCLQFLKYVSLLLAYLGPQGVAFAASSVECSSWTFFGSAGSLQLCEGFLQMWRAAATLCSGAQVSHCGGFSCRRAWTPQHGLRSCGTWVQLPHGMWDLPGPGIEPISPALAGRFLTTGPPRKSTFCVFHLTTAFCPSSFS